MSCLIILAPYDKIVDRQNSNAALSHVYISSNVIPNYLSPHDRMLDRQNAIQHYEMFIYGLMLNQYLSPR